MVLVAAHNSDSSNIPVLSIESTTSQEEGLKRAGNTEKSPKETSLAVFRKRSSWQKRLDMASNLRFNAAD